MDKRIVDSYPVIAQSRDIAFIAKPLERLGITYFAFVKIDKNNKFSGFCNNQKWLQHYLEKDYFLIDLFAHSELIDLKDDYTYKLFKDDSIPNYMYPLIYDAYQFNVWTSFYIAENHPGCQYIYHFGTEANNKKSYEYYYQKIDMLKAFISYFKEKISQNKSLKNSLSTTIKLPSPKKKEIKIDVVNRVYAQKNEIDFYKTIQINKYILNEIGGNQHLTEKELQCLRFLKQGKSSIEISRLLNRSPRTIEEHIKNIKTKLDCSTLFQLGNLIEKFPLNSFIIE